MDRPGWVQDAETDGDIVRVGQIGQKPDGYWLLCEDGYARKYEEGVLLYVVLGTEPPQHFAARAGDTDATSRSSYFSTEVVQVPERPTDGEMYVWLVGNIEWLERTQELLTAAFMQLEAVEDRERVMIAMHRFGVQLASMRRLRALYEELTQPQLSAAPTRECL